MWKNATNAKEQSYLSLDGKEWFDLIDLGTEIAGLEKTNICLKAFTEETSSGDINLDEQFDIIDLSVTVQYFSNTIKNLSDEAKNNLDMNQDGNMDMMDLSKMILILANLE